MTNQKKIAEFNWKLASLESEWEKLNIVQFNSQISYNFHKCKKIFNEA